MKSELCKTCIHTKVCMKDKNLVGDVPVMGHPMFFDNDKLYEEYKEREKQGFPCEDYMSTAEIEEKLESAYAEGFTAAESKFYQREKGEWIEKDNRAFSGYEDGQISWYECSVCGCEPLRSKWDGESVLSNFCPFCGAKMEAKE